MPVLALSQTNLRVSDSWGPKWVERETQFLPWDGLGRCAWGWRCGRQMTGHQLTNWGVISVTLEDHTWGVWQSWHRCCCWFEQTHRFNTHFTSTQFTLLEHLIFQQCWIEKADDGPPGRKLTDVRTGWVCGARVSGQVLLQQTMTH